MGLGDVQRASIPIYRYADVQKRSQTVTTFSLLTASSVRMLFGL
jgi:hypothetical protein